MRPLGRSPLGCLRPQKAFTTGNGVASTLRQVAAGRSGIDSERWGSNKANESRMACEYKAWLRYSNRWHRIPLPITEAMGFEGAGFVVKCVDGISFLGVETQAVPTNGGKHGRRQRRKVD